MIYSGSEINNPWRRGSYIIFRHMGGQISVFINKNVTLTHTLSGSILSAPKILVSIFLTRTEKFSIFFSGCLDLSVNLVTGNMVLVQNVQ